MVITKNVIDIDLYYKWACQKNSGWSHDFPNSIYFGTLSVLSKYQFASYFWTQRQRKSEEAYLSKTLLYVSWFKKCYLKSKNVKTGCINFFLYQNLPDCDVANFCAFCLNKAFFIHETWQSDVGSIKMLRHIDVFFRSIKENHKFLNLEMFQIVKKLHLRLVFLQINCIGKINICNSMTKT